MKYEEVPLSYLEHSEKGSYKIGPFGSALKKAELVEEGIPVAGIANVLAEGFNQNFHKFITEEKYTQLERYEVIPGDVVVTTMGTVGRAAVIPDGLGKLIIDSHLFRMRVDKTKVFPQYLAYALNEFEGLKRQIELRSHGAIMSGLNTTILKTCTIPLPPLEEQKRIAAVLDKAAALRTQRQQALAKLDTLLQSVFLDMFGDPFLNPKGWKELAIGETAEHFSDGPFGSNLKSSHYQDEGVRVIRLQNIGVGEFIDDDKAFISEEHFNSLPRHHCLPNDVIIGTMGNPNLRAFIIPDWLEKSLNKADCVLYRVNKQLMTSEYACWLLNNPSTLQKASTLSLGQTRLRISMGRLRGMEVPVPPLSHQKEFVKIVKQIEEQKNIFEESALSLDSLFNSLQQRAFRGDL